MEICLSVHGPNTISKVLPFKYIYAVLNVYFECLFNIGSSSEVGSLLRMPSRLVITPSYVSYSRDVV